MKILVISATFPPTRSGGADYALRLCQHLADAGLEVQVITSYVRNGVKDSRLKIYPVMNRWSWREWPRLMRIALRFRPDVINLHFNGAIYKHNPMITMATFFFKKLLPHTRLVTHIEDGFGLQWQPPSSIFERIMRKALSIALDVPQKDFSFGRILRDSDGIIVLSDLYRIELENFLPGVSSKCVLLPPPPILRMSDANEDSRIKGKAMLKVGLEDTLISYYGYICRGKGIELLLEAFAALHANNPSLKLILIGGSTRSTTKRSDNPEYIEELRAIAENLGLPANSLIWTGYYDTNSQDASLYLRASDICVLPYERGVYLNNSSFSAVAAHQLPIVTTKGEIVEPPFRNRENLLFAERKNSDSLREAIDEVLNSIELKERIARGSLELSQEYFSWKKTMDRTIEIFQPDSSQNIS